MHIKVRLGGPEPTTVLNEFGYTPLTTQQLYEVYIALGKALYVSVAPTAVELQDMAIEVAEEYLTDWVVNTEQSSGDFGFTAVFILESRELIEEEARAK